MMMRTEDGKTAGEVAVAFDTFLTALGDGISELTINGMRRSASGSDLSFPADTTGLDASYGTGVGNLIDVPLQATFTGRSSDGRDARTGFFGWNGQTDSSWRYTTAENSDVAAAVGALQSLTTAGFFVSITGQPVFWHTYMNIGYNDHWVKEQRG